MGISLPQAFLTDLRKNIFHCSFLALAKYWVYFNKSFEDAATIVTSLPVSLLTILSMTMRMRAPFDTTTKTTPNDDDDDDF